jgi:hypothetical protein
LVFQLGREYILKVYIPAEFTFCAFFSLYSTEKIKIFKRLSLFGESFFLLSWRVRAYRFGGKKNGFATWCKMRSKPFRIGGIMGI